MTTESQSREEFEIRARLNYNLTRQEDGHYASFETQHLWRVWQAAIEWRDKSSMAASDVQVSAPCGRDMGNKTNNPCSEAAAKIDT